MIKMNKQLLQKITQYHTPYSQSQMAANLGQARGQTWNRGVLG